MAGFDPSTEVDAASARAMALGSCRFHTVKNILAAGQDHLPLEPPAETAPTPTHANIRNADILVMPRGPPIAVTPCSLYGEWGLRHICTHQAWRSRRSFLVALCCSSPRAARARSRSGSLTFVCQPGTAACGASSLATVGVMFT